MERVVAIDASQILTIIRRTGIEGLSALYSRGDRFFFSEDLKQELLAADEWESKNGRRLQDWLEEQRVNKRLIEVKKRILPEEYEVYDFGKRGTSRGGSELSDMSIRKFMLQNKSRFTFEVISRDRGLLDHHVDDPSHPLFGLQFERLSMRSALTWLATHPDVNHNPERLQSLLQALHHGKFDMSRDHGVKTHELERETFYLPETYEDAVRVRARRAETETKRPSDMKGLSGHTTAHLGGAPLMPPDGIPVTPSGLPIEGRTDGEVGLSRGLQGKGQGLLQEGPSIGGRFMSLARNGAPVAVLGIAAGAILPQVKAHAEMRNIPFAQAARELGLEFGEEELKNLMAEVGVDLAVSLTPVGLVKKAWDVLGNIDDIVAVTQLYGAAYPKNETIQRLAEIADAVENSESFGAYIESRDALTGAVGDVIDAVFGGSADEETALEGLDKLQSALAPEAGPLNGALPTDATREEIAERLQSAVGTTFGSSPIPLANFPVIPGAQPILKPGFVASAEVPSSVKALPGPEAFVTPVSEHLEPFEPSSVETKDPAVRNTSYDRLRKLGRTPEEEALAIDEYQRHLRESFVDLDGDIEAAQYLAVEQLRRDWDVSAFAPEGEGTIMKNPVERAYPALDDSGHQYVERDVEALLAGQGISAARWYLSPNEKTGSDRTQGATDAEGYGPRMTLAYDDEAGVRHHVTDNFQANVWGASKHNVAKESLQSRRLDVEEDVPVPAPKTLPVSGRPVPAPKPQRPV